MNFMADVKCRFYSRITSSRADAVLSALYTWALYKGGGIFMLSEGGEMPGVGGLSTFSVSRGLKRAPRRFIVAFLDTLHF